MASARCSRSSPTAAINGSTNQPAAVTSPVVVGEQGGLYVATDAGLLSLSNTGEFRWLWSASGNVGGQPAVAADGTIYSELRSPDPKGNALVAWHPDGTARWRFKLNSV